MEILGRIREVLTHYDYRGSEKRIYTLMAQAVLSPGAIEPQGVMDGFDDEKNIRRWVYEVFRTTGEMRAFSRLDTATWPHEKYQKRCFEHWRDHAERLVDVGLPPVHALWYHWILLAGERCLHIPADRALLKRLWFRGFYEQQGDGRLLRWPLDGSTDSLVYDELTAIHAAYNAAKIIGDPDAGPMMEQVRRAVRWHVDNTQPDNTTNEPWALAAFATLDDTHTFAEQQLHDAVTWLRNAAPLPNGKVPAAVGLLADAAMTLENW